jgi:hypothetical protein
MSSETAKPTSDGVLNKAQFRAGSGAQASRVEIAGGPLTEGAAYRVMSLSAALDAFGPDVVAQFAGMAQEAQRYAKKKSGQVVMTGGGAAVKEHIKRAREAMKSLPAPDHLRYLAKMEGSQLGQHQPEEDCWARKVFTAADITHMDRVWDLLLAWKDGQEDYRRVLLVYVTGLNLTEIGRKEGISKQMVNRRLDRACNALARDMVSPSLPCVTP